ncbi:MAG TPA: HAMP domain-containing protein [Xanthomonadales bacterium]|nr:HAMP domain-containing protein [Xanthomonadales bacterium]
MKLTFNFQTLILLTLTSVLIVATAIWGGLVYQSIYDIILRGFDQKLLALAGAAAEFTDGDGHAQYQRPHQLLALGSGPDGQLLGFDATRETLVVIDPADGGALRVDDRALLQTLDSPGLKPPRALAFDAASGTLALLSGDGLSLVSSDALPLAPPQALAAPADGLLFVDGLLLIRSGQTLTLAGGDAPALTLAEAVSTLANAPAPAAFVGMAASDAALVWFDRDGKLLRRLPLALGERANVGLAYVGATLYLASDALLRIDPDSGEIAEDFAPGYYSERDPYFARYAGPYQRTREAAGLTFLYTDVHLGSDQIRYVLDGSTGDEHSPPGTLDVVPEESVADVAQAQSKGQAFVSDIREWEEWGLIKVSAEPIYASNGQVVALAGADVDIGLIREKTRFALFSVIFVGAGLLLLAGSVSYRVSQGLVRPLRDIKDSALRIAAGYHGTRVAHDSNDEIGQLAQSLNALSTRLAAQSRQSQAYQDALSNGREQIVLEHAVSDLLDAGALALPAGMSLQEPASPGSVCAVGALGMLWTLRATAGEPLDDLADLARTQQLARHLLQTQPQGALDMLFLTLPGISVLGLWDADARSLSLRCRAATTLQLRRTDGTLASVDCSDGALLELKSGEQLLFGPGRVLHGPQGPEAGAPC